MPTINKQSCPTCGQSVNQREIGLFSGMVTALQAVYKWCQEKDRYEFTHKDIKHLLKDDNQIARFGDWVMFGGLVYKNGKGNYGLNKERCDNFFNNQYTIPTIIYKNPLTKELQKERYRYFNQIPGLNKYLDQKKQFVARYRSEPKYHTVRAIFIGLNKAKALREKKTTEIQLKPLVVGEPIQVVGIDGDPVSRTYENIAAFNRSWKIL